MATALAATASGGATMAPRANAAANGSGSSAHASRPIPAAVNSTRPIDSQPIADRLSRKSIRLVLCAAVALLFTARYPDGIFDAVMGMDRWALSYSCRRPAKLPCTPP